MIAALKGCVKTLAMDHIVLDVQGVGYEVFMSTNTLASISLNTTISLDIYTHIREDVLKLYGFMEALEKTLFLAFIGINGIGPKMALALLSSTASLNILVEMIEKEDVKNLAKLPRVGKKTAGQMVLSLKGRLPPSLSSKATSSHTATRQWLTSALLNLGFKSAEIHTALNQISIGKDRQKELKKVLSCLSPGT